MADKKNDMIRLGQYLISKNDNKLGEKTKYLKLGYGPKASKEQKDVVDRLIKALGTDVIYVNLFDDAFRKEHNIQDFVKGSISISANPPKDSKASVQASSEDEF